MMKTFSGNVYTPKEYIDESILSSTNSGKSAYVEKWASENLFASQYKINTDFSIEALDDINFKGRTKVPVWIKDAHKNIITYDNCANVSVTLPHSAKSVRFINCTDLENIDINGASDIDTLYFEDCKKLNFANLKNNNDLKVRRIKIINCGINTLSDLTFVSNVIVVEKCKLLNIVDAPLNPMLSVTISKCPIKKFDNVKLSILTMSELRQGKKMNINIVRLDELNIFDCDNLTNLTITGNKIQQVSISDCESLEALNMENNCTVSLNLSGLPSITTYNLPEKISGSCTINDVMTEPRIECKKLIKAK